MAEQHGWGETTTACTVYLVYGAVFTWKGAPDEADYWLQRAERTVKAEAVPATVLLIRHARAVLELARAHILVQHIRRVGVRNQRDENFSRWQLLYKRRRGIRNPLTQQKHCAELDLLVLESQAIFRKKQLPLVVVGRKTR